MLEKTLTTNSLKIIKKALSSKARKEKRKIKEISLHHGNHSTATYSCKKAYYKTMGAIASYRFMRR